MKMTIWVELEEGFPLEDQHEIDWFNSEVLSESGSLVLHSNEVGDTVGVVTKIRNVSFIPRIELPVSEQKVQECDATEADKKA